MKRSEELLAINCPLGITQTVIAGKWKIVILWELKDGVKRFNQLNKALPQIRQGYLAQQLRQLETDGIIHREVYKEVPPKVEYSLTEVGFNFVKVLDSMCAWGLNYMKFLEAN